MTYCNPTTVLDKALNKHCDDSSELRAKALSWFNEVVRDILNQPRTWNFLVKSSTRTISTNVISLPSDFGQVISIQGSDFFFDKDDQLSEEEVFIYDEYLEDTTDGPIGFYMTKDVSSNDTITFYPSATGTVSLLYETNLTSDYTDTSSDTIFPIQFENVLIAGVRKHLYDYDKDARLQKAEWDYNGVGNNQSEMYKVKAWDNQRKPMPKINSHGYVRNNK